MKLNKAFFSFILNVIFTWFKIFKIIVNNIGGPLKHLKNEWEIRDINAQSEVNYVIDFEIKNVFYNMIMKKSFDQGLSSIADAFEKRAIYLFKNT